MESGNYTASELQPEDEKPSDVFIEIEIPYHLYQYLSSENCSIHSLCRICLAIGATEMYPLLSIKDSNVLAEMFTALTSIQVANDDGLPAQICSTCQTLIIQYYEFKIQCEKADYTLKSVLKGEFIAKEDPSFRNNGSFIKETKKNEVEIVIKEEQDIDNAINLKNFEDSKASVTQSEVISNESDLLCVVQGETSTEKNDIEVSVTDSKTLLDEIIHEKQKNRKKQKSFYKCPACTKTFLKLYLLKQHRKEEHNTESKLYSCDYCKNLFNSEHDLKLHLSLHTKGSTWKCSKCSKEFNNKNGLRRHIKRHMETKKYSCNSCGKIFVELYALRRHARVHTGETVERKHACHLCDKRFERPMELATHLQRHSGARPCVCAECGKAFVSKRFLLSHALTHSDHKPYTCAYCDKRFRHKSTQNTHQRVHTGERPYVCSACGMSFIQASNLKLHMRTHTGERPYQCSVCGRRFTSGSSLKAHARTHTGERPYACTICGKSFARQSLRTHMRQHNGERPYECIICQKKFINAATLREHVRTHTGEKPFECSICSCKFQKKTHLLTHLKTHKDTKIKRKCTGSKLNLKTTLEGNLIEEVPVKMKKKLLIHNDNNIETNILLVDHHGDDNDIHADVVTEELVVQDDSNMNTNILVVDHTPVDVNNLNSNTVHILNNDLNYANDLKLVTVNEGEVSIASGVLEGTTVKLYQLDQSLVQIHSSGGQVTISKITSKMTANFE